MEEWGQFKPDEWIWVGFTSWSCFQVEDRCNRSLKSEFDECAQVVIDQAIDYCTSIFATCFIHTTIIVHDIIDYMVCMCVCVFKIDILFALSHPAYDKHHAHAGCSLGQCSRVQE